MSRVYLSSTFSDLEECREKVYRVLRQMRHDVIAMEDGVSTNRRPLEQCLADVESCELYVGIFAWRYGHIPVEKNPERKSITELELRHAWGLDKDCLLFFIDTEAPWPMSKVEHEALERVWSLRREFSEKRHTSFFKGAEDLAAKVSAAVAVWQAEHVVLTGTGAPKRPTTPQQREVNRHALLAYAGVDEPFALQLGKQLGLYGRNLLLYAPALFASQPEDFQELENRVRQCHTAMVVLSDPMLVQMQQRAEESRQILQMLRSRTGHLIFLCRTESSLARAAEWEPTQVINASRWDIELGGAQILEVDRAIAAGYKEGRTGTVGLPFLIVAMKDREARELAQNPDLIQKKLGTDTSQRFADLLKALKSSPLEERYGSSREDWQPFLGSPRTIGAVIGSVVDRLNDLRMSPLRGRAIKVQHYSFDSLLKRDELLMEIYREIGQTGCVVLVDELSMFHPEVRAAFLESVLPSSALATLVTISPFDPYGVPLNEMLETELRRRLADAFRRFTQFDPLCEFGIGSEQRLKRWFHGSLPEALRNLRAPGPNPRLIEAFERNVQPEDPVEGAALVYSSGKSF